MVSEMAIEDCTDLMNQGAKLTVEEIVRLNALGVKAKCGAHASSFDALPRCAILGDLVFREPTIRHEIWMDEASRIFSRGDALTGFALRAFATTAMADDLPDWSSVREMQRALSKFMSKKLSRFTVRQVTSCVRYVLAGDDWTVGEDPVARDGDCDDVNGETTSAAAGVLRQGVALRLGISVDDAMRMTRRELQTIIQRVFRMEGINVDEDVRNDAIGAYNSTYEHIRNAHAEELKGGEQA